MQLQYNLRTRNCIVISHEYAKTLSRYAFLVQALRNTKITSRQETPANAVLNGLVIGYYLNYLVVKYRRWNYLPTEVVCSSFEVCDYCGL